MSSSLPETALYEPISQGRRTTNKARRSGLRRFFGRRCLIVISLVISTVLGYLFFYFLKNVWLAMNHPRLHLYKHEEDLKAKNLTSHNRSSIARVTSGFVPPLIRSQDKISIQATVWLDVTQHLEQGNLLPKTKEGKDLELVTYFTIGNKTRTEAILHSGVVFDNIVSTGYHFTQIPISIPIDPLYTQDLGPSTLRLTYVAEVPQSVTAEFGQFITSKSVFPFSSHVLPRSKTSVRIRKGCDGSQRDSRNIGGANETGAISIEEALEFNGASVNLLDVARSERAIRNCTYTDNRYRGPMVSSFLDGAPNNLNFTTNTVMDEQGSRLILRDNCTIIRPFIKSQSRLNMIEAYDIIDRDGYEDVQDSVTKEFLSCFPKDDRESHAGCLVHLRKEAPFENRLWFSNRANIPERINHDKYFDDSFSFYAPALVQRSFSTPPYDQHLLPRSRPKGYHSTNSKSKKGPGSILWFAQKAEEKKSQMREGCRLPELKPDSKNEYFDIDLKIRFGSISNFRANIYGESTMSYKSMYKTRYLSEGEQEAPVYTTAQYDGSWEAESFIVGDRTHPSSKPITKLLMYNLIKASQMGSILLGLLYWYTRTTTAGLALRAQVLYMIGDIFFLILKLRDIYLYGFGMNILLALILLTQLFLTVLTIARIEIIYPLEDESFFALRITQRPQSKTEKRCDRYEKQIGLLGPIIVSAT